MEVAAVVVVVKMQFLELMALAPAAETLAVAVAVVAAMVRIPMLGPELLEALAVRGLQVFTFFRLPLLMLESLVVKAAAVVAAVVVTTQMLRLAAVAVVVAQAPRGYLLIVWEMALVVLVAVERVEMLGLHQLPAMAAPVVLAAMVAEQLD